MNMNHDSVLSTLRTYDTYLGSIHQNLDLNVKDELIVATCKRILRQYDIIMSQNNREKRSYKPIYSSSKKCYLCKQGITNGKIMCNACLALNKTKRYQTSDLTGKVAVVTGGRIKIGFYTALKLLRAGAVVLISTRFVVDAQERYSAEKDYQEWKSRLFICYSDFRMLSSVNEFVNYVRSNFTQIDYLINNAAQTLDRPIEFYKTLLEKENNCAQLLQHGEENSILTTPCLFDLNIVNTYFPPDIMDEYNQQVDLRKTNSWKETIETTPLRELTDVLTINTIVPFYLIQSLNQLLRRNHQQESSYIINVSSMEGKFNRHKGEGHPHTNMAKASLNMITKTIGEAFKRKYNTITVSVDTGWNTIEDPVKLDQITPIDCIDGAARVLDPIFNKYDFAGVFYKDFEITDW